MIYPKKLTAAQWAEENITLRSGDIGIEHDTKKRKVGDGLTPWNKLSYVFDAKKAAAALEAKLQNGGGSGGTGSTTPKLAEDPYDPGTFIVVGGLTEDPSDPGVFLIGG